MRSSTRQVVACALVQLHEGRLPGGDVGDGRGSERHQLHFVVALSHDPFFAVVMGIVGLGVVLTTIGLVRERGKPATG